MKGLLFIFSLVSVIILAAATSTGIATAIQAPDWALPIGIIGVTASFLIKMSGVASVDLITHALTYTREDAQRFFLQPLFTGNPSLEIFEVMLGVKSSQKLDKFSTLSKITLGEAPGFAGGAGVTLTQRPITVARMEAEVGQAGGAFFNSVKGELLRLGIDKDNIDGTILKQIVADIFMTAIRADLERQLYFGDTGSASADFNEYDGIFKQLEALPGPQQLVIGAGALAADEAEDTFQLMYDAAPPELTAMRDNAVILASRSMVDNYKRTLKDDGTELAHQNIVDGVQRLWWDGIPVLERQEWDVHIAADALANDAHRAILTVRDNIVVATDFDDNVSAEEWYNPDEKQNRMRFQYLMGTNFKNDELTTTAIAA